MSEPPRTRDTPAAGRGGPGVSLKQRVLSGGAWVLAGKVATVLATLATEALLTRLLPPETYGVYVQAFRLVVLATMVSQLGLQTAVVRLVAVPLSDHPAQVRASVGLVYRWVLVGIIVVVLALVLGGGRWIAEKLWHEPLLGAVIGAVAAWAVVMSLQVLTSETFRGFKDLRLASLFGGVITGALSVLLLGVLWLVRGSAELREVIAVIGLATALSVALGLVALRRKLVRLPRGGSVSRREVLALSGPLWINALLTYALTQSDVWILGIYRPSTELALYGAAARMVNVVSMPLILINLVVPPFVAELYAKGDRVRLQRLLRNAAAVAGLPGFAVLLTFVIAGEPVLGFVFGDYYRGAALVLALLSVGKLANVWTGSCGITLTMTGHQTPMMFITMVASIVTVAATVFAAQRWGAAGVAGAVCVGTILHNLAFWLAARHYTGLWTHARIPRPREIRELLRG